jgi:hypothetical protein
MSYKTEKLVDLFPDVFAARDRSSLLYKLLDAVGAELMRTDESIKQLLKSHWIDYAEGAALDGLGAIFRVERRRLPNGTPEPDGAFRLRLKSVVSLFTGGGTREAVLGAVRSALGLPFHLSQLRGVPAALLQDLEKLIILEEFSPNPERFFDAITDLSDAGQLTLDIPIVSVFETRPNIEWIFTQGGGRRLELERLDSGEGIKSVDSLVVPQGVALRLSADADGNLIAFLGTTDVAAQFTNLDDTTPAVMPTVPGFASTWQFRAQSGLFGISTFDASDTFDLPLFSVEMTWRSFTPLTFDVIVPYFLKQAIDNLKALHGFTGDIFVFEGLDYNTIQQVVDQTRAAGVRGTVQFSLTHVESHDQRESLRIHGDHRHTEDAGQHDSLTTASGARLVEPHDVAERLSLGAVFDVSRFDGSFGFV